MRQHVVSMFGHREILHTHTLFGPETLEEDETACSVYVRTQGNTTHTHTLFGPETLEEDETACSVYVRTQRNTTHTHSVWTRDTRGG